MFTIIRVEMDSAKNLSEKRRSPRSEELSRLEIS
jgi:hypothetical protein